MLNYNREDYVKTVSELKLLPNIINPIKKLKENNFLIIVITNQSAINRGLTTIEEVQKINASIQGRQPFLRVEKLPQSAPQKSENWFKKVRVVPHFANILRLF